MITHVNCSMILELSEIQTCNFTDRADPCEGQGDRLGPRL